MKEGLLVVFLFKSVRYSLLGFYLESSNLIKNSPILVAIVRVGEAQFFQHFNTHS